MSNSEQVSSAVSCYDRHINEAARFVLTPELQAKFVREGLISFASPARLRSATEIKSVERAQMAAELRSGKSLHHVASIHQCSTKTAKYVATHLNARGSDAAQAERTNAEAAGDNSPAAMPAHGSEVSQPSQTPAGAGRGAGPGNLSKS